MSGLSKSQVYLILRLLLPILTVIIPSSWKSHNCRSYPFTSLTSRGRFQRLRGGEESVNGPLRFSSGMGPGKEKAWDTSDENPGSNSDLSTDNAIETLNEVVKRHGNLDFMMPNIEKELAEKEAMERARQQPSWWEEVKKVANERNLSYENAGLEEPIAPLMENMEKLLKFEPNKRRSREEAIEEAQNFYFSTYRKNATRHPETTLEKHLKPITDIQLRDVAYWDQFSQKRGPKQPYEWMCRCYDVLDTLQSELHLTMASFTHLEDSRPSKLRILVPGSGCSRLSAHLYELGYIKLVNVDFSSVAIRQMQYFHEHVRPKMRWVRADVTSLTFEPEVVGRGEGYGAIIDKGLLDSMAGGEGDEEGKLAVGRYLRQVRSILQSPPLNPSPHLPPPPSGVFMVVTYGQRHVVQYLLHHFPHHERWGFRIYRIFTGNPSPPFLIAIRKYPPGAQNAHRMSFQFQLNDVNAGDETSSLTGDLGLSSLLLAILSSEDMLSMSRLPQEVAFRDYLPDSARSNELVYTEEDRASCYPGPATVPPKKSRKPPPDPLEPTSQPQDGDRDDQTVLAELLGFLDKRKRNATDPDAESSDFL